MKKRFLPILMLLCFVLTACGSKKPSDVSEGMYNVGTQALETVDDLLAGRTTIDSTLDKLDALLETAGAVENSSYIKDMGITTSIRLFRIMMLDIENGYGSKYDYDDIRETRDQLATYLGKK